MSERRTAIYWLHHVDPRLTCGEGECVAADAQCGKCARAEATIRRHERASMRDDLLRAMGLGTRHGDVQVRQ